MDISDSQIGKQVGNYRLLAKINSGSFSSVYQGKHIIFEDEPAVAIKLLRAVLHSQQERLEFIKEAQLLKKLQHPHILHILDAGFQGGIPYLVTEYAAGGSLRDQLHKYNGQSMPIDEAMTILTQIGEALQYAHQQHIVHRDLKPENILFNDQGNVLLADFGIAVVLASTFTGQVGFSGTPSYMAPEQFEGLASAKSDQYALGCIAYELVTGRRLFNIPNPTLEAYWYHHAKIEPVPPTRYNLQLPALSEEAILIALAKERFNRYSDVSTFMEALSETGQQWQNDDLYDETDDDWDDNRYYEYVLLECERAICLNPNDASLYNKKAMNLRNLERYGEALAAYNQAIRLDPTDATTFREKAVTLWYLERYEEALTACDQAIRLNPNDASLYNTKAMNLRNLERYEEALVALDQAICLDPHHGSTYSQKGSVLNVLKRYEEALASYNKLISLAPESASAYQGKAVVLRNLERYEEASEAEIAAMDISIEHQFDI
jgi:serine/threonine protein kinase